MSFYIFIKGNSKAPFGPVMQKAPPCDHVPIAYSGTGPRLNIKTSYLRMVISMLKIRRPLGRLIFNMGIAILGETVFLIETAPWSCENQMVGSCRQALPQTLSMTDGSACQCCRWTRFQWVSSAGSREIYEIHEWLFWHH